MRHSRLTICIAVFLLLSVLLSGCSEVIPDQPSESKPAESQSGNTPSAEVSEQEPVSEPDENSADASAIPDESNEPSEESSDEPSDGQSAEQSEADEPSADASEPASSDCDHQFDEWAVKSEPTCAKEGVKERTCSLCGETETEQIAKRAHTVEEDPGKPATCTENGLTDGTHCSVCGAVIKKQEVIKASHKYKDTVVAATPEADGYTLHECTVCGDSYKDKYTKYKESGTTSGKGTKDAPYLVSSEKDLKNLSSYLKKAGLYFRQTCDITLTGTWEPIGDDSKPFKNNYDGGGYAIKGLKITDSDADYSGYRGLFGQAESCTFSNIRIENAELHYNKSSESGGILGYGYNVKFENCFVSATLNGSPDRERFGMLAGTIFCDFDLKTLAGNCRAEGKMTNCGDNTGGLFGMVTGMSDYDEKAQKTIYTSPLITDCSSAVTISAKSDVGGLIGYMYAGNVTKSYATGNLTMTGRNGGGLIGEIEYPATVSRCFATGNVTNSSTKGYGNAFLGGLIGVCAGIDIHDCYATGDVFTDSSWNDCSDETDYAGGSIWYRYRNPVGSLIGCLRAEKYWPFCLYNCYATGTADGKVTDGKLCICTDEMCYCHGALVGLVYDGGTKDLIPQKYQVISPDIDMSRNIDITEDMLEGSVIVKMSGNYSTGTLRETYTPINVIVKSENKRYLTGQYKSMPVYRVTTNVSDADIRKQSTFAGWNFETVWEMGANGPQLRGVK